MRSGSRPPAPPAPPEMLLTNFQRRAVFAMFGAGIGYLLVGLLLLPHGAVFWLAFVVAPPLLGGVAALFAGGLGRRLEAWLLNADTPQPAWSPPAATALPEATRLGLQVAAVPALLGELVRATGAVPGLVGDALRGAKQMPAREKAAAARLAEAAVAAWHGPDAARDVLAQELPRLVAGLAEGGSAAIQAAEDAATRFARMAGGTT